MDAGSHRTRFENALEGAAEQPPVAGITFVPAFALMGTGAGALEAGDPSDALATAAGALRVDFAFVPADVPWSAAAAKKLGSDGRAVVWAVKGPLWPVLDAKGIVSVLKQTAWEPERLDGSLDAEVERGREALLAGASLGVAAIAVCDDLAGSSGPLVSPDYFNEHLVHRYAALVSAAASVGLRAVFHSDGDARAFLPGLARAGFIGLHGGGGLTKEAFDLLLESARGRGLSMLGGIATPALGQGPHASVRAGTHAAVLARVGGLLLADDGGITKPSEMASLATAFGAAGVGLSSG